MSYVFSTGSLRFSICKQRARYHKVYVRKNNMASGSPVNFYVVEPIVESVFNSKIPDLMEVMRDARARALARFDEKALRLEGCVLRAAQQLKAHCPRIAQERSFGILRGTFNTMWHSLNNEFRRFRAHCLYLGISLSDTECLVLTDDEPSSSEGSDETSSSDEEEEEAREE